MNKCKIYFLFFFLLPVFTGVANASVDYHEQEIYIKLNQEAAKRLIDQHGKVDIVQFKAQFSTLLSDASVATISAPFFAAKSEDLKRILQVVFETAIDLDQLNEQLNRHPSVIYAEKVPKDYLMNDTYAPNDIGANTSNGQWYLHKIQAPEAWFISKGNREIKVAVVDDAIDILHPDLVNNLWTNPLEIPDNGIDDDGNGYIDDVHGYDVGDNDGNPGVPNNQRSHGTHVAGLVSATTDNGLGIASIGFNLSLISVKCTRDASSSLLNTYQGIVYATEAGADIINCSWGGNGASATNAQVVQYASSQGCIIVAAAGNDGNEVRMYPAVLPGVISVGSTNTSDRVSGFSTYGTWVSVFAPGSGIRSTLPGNRYGRQNGTSMASPIVAGLLGLMKSVYPSIDPQSLKDCLLQSADSIEHLNDTTYIGKTGAGRINAFKAMQCVDALPQPTKILNTSLTKASLLLYPNPAQNELTVRVLGADLKGSGMLTFYDLTGRIVQKHQYNNLATTGLHNGLRLVTGSILPGIYFLVLEMEQGKVQAKVVIER